MTTTNTNGNGTNGATVPAAVAARSTAPATGTGRLDTLRRKAQQVSTKTGAKLTRKTADGSAVASFDGAPTHRTESSFTNLAALDGFKLSITYDVGGAKVSESYVIPSDSGADMAADMFGQ